MKQSESSFQKSRGDLSSEDAQRAWFASLLWSAFPKSRSEHELAERAATVLTRKNAPVSSRQVRHWLRGESSAKLHHVMAVIAIAGAEIVFRRMESSE